MVSVMMEWRGNTDMVCMNLNKQGIIFWNEFFVSFLSTGRPFCLKCMVTAPEAKIEPRNRKEPPQIRSLESLRADFDRFTTAGGDHTKAKNYKNVIAMPFFDIPLHQVQYIVQTATFCYLCTNNQFFHNIEKLRSEIKGVSQNCSVCCRCVMLVSTLVWA